MDNIKTWTELTMKESIRMAEDRDKWRRYVDGVVNPCIEDCRRTEQNTVYLSVNSPELIFHLTLTQTLTLALTLIRMN